MNNVKFKQDIGNTVDLNDAKFSDKSSLRFPEDAIPVKAVHNVHSSKMLQASLPQNLTSEIKTTKNW